MSHRTTSALDELESAIEHGDMAGIIDGVNRLRKDALAAGAADREVSDRALREQVAWTVAAERQRDEARAVLRSLEWRRDVSEDGAPYCVICGFYQKNGHSDHCRLAAALGAP